MYNRSGGLQWVQTTSSRLGHSLLTDDDSKLESNRIREDATPDQVCLPTMERGFQR
jgi:hypothetical protein